MSKTFLSRLLACAALAAAPLTSHADLLYKHFLHGGDGGFGLFESPEFDTLPVTFEFFVGQPGTTATTGALTLNEGTNTVDFSGDLLQTMKVKSADGVIDPTNADDFWALKVVLNGLPQGNFGRDPAQEAYDVQNQDTPQQTTFNPAYLEALTGADIQAIRLTITNVCFAGPDVVNDCAEFPEMWSGVSGNAYLEFFGERRQVVSEGAILPMLLTSVLLGIGCARRRRA